MRSTLIVVFAACTLFWSGCGKSEAVKQAEKLCNCSKDLISIIGQMKANPEQMEEIMPKLERMEKDFDNCMGGEAEMKKLDEQMEKNEEFRKEFDKTIESKCPELKALIQ